jgi:diguanylate cyclase (GGDEF)-like protein
VEASKSQSTAADDAAVVSTEAHECYADVTDPATLLKAGLDDFLHARIRRSYDAFLRASLMLEQSDDVCLYARALALLSYVASSRGHNDEAMESAFLSCRLLREVGSPEQQAFAQNYLGVALMWNGNHDRAAEEFRAVIAGIRASGNSFMTPFVNICCTEILRQNAYRHSLSREPDAGALSDLLKIVDLRSPEADAGMVHTGSPKHLEYILGCVDGIRCAWSNDLRLAKVRIDRCRALAAEPDFQVWATPMEHWLRAEVCLVERDFTASVEATQEMVDSAIGLQHEQFASLALNLMALILTRQGKAAEALSALKQLTTRQQAVRTESLYHCQRISIWQATLYEQRNDAAHWQATSSRYHALSMQDPLTGLANRRGLDDALQKRLGITPSLHVIVLDVDQFKSVNDNFSHLIGDKVLQAVSATLQAQLRQSDVAARIGGDEFMLALQGLEDEQTVAVCERIRQCVISYPWEEVAPGLSVTVSLGWSAATPGDTIEALVARSDSQMYTDKQSRKRPRGGVGG